MDINNTVARRYLSLSINERFIYSVDKAPSDLLGSLKQLEKDSGREIAMAGLHNLKTMFVMLMLE